MGNFQSSLNNTVQDVSDKIANVTTQTCSNVIQPAVTGNMIVVTGGSGGVTLKNTANMSGTSCDMAVSVQSSITDNLNQNISQNNNSPSFTFGYNIENDVNNSITSSTHRVLNKAVMSCSNAVVEEIANNFIISTDSSGNIFLGNTGSLTSAQCMQQVSASTIANTSMTDTVAQSNTTSLFGGIGGIIAVVVVVIVLVIVLKTVSKSGQPPPQMGMPGGPPGTEMPSLGGGGKGGGLFGKLKGAAGDAVKVGEKDPELFLLSRAAPMPDNTPSTVLEKLKQLHSIIVQTPKTA